MRTYIIENYANHAGARYKRMILYARYSKELQTCDYITTCANYPTHM